MSLKMLTKVSMLALVAGLTVGCATPDVQKDINEAKAMARQALDAANASNACCQDNSEKLNRVFKKSMYK